MSLIRTQLRVAMPVVVASTGISIALYFLLCRQPIPEARRGFLLKEVQDRNAWTRIASTAGRLRGASENIQGACKTDPTLQLARA